MATNKNLIKISLVWATILLFVMTYTIPIAKEIAMKNSANVFNIKNTDDNKMFSPLSISSSLKFNTFAANYFYNLIDYHTNVSGSCGYIAIQMLLSFYNHYWNDDIISEQYETTATSDYELNSKVPGTTDAFHDLLVQLGAQLGYELALPNCDSFKQIADLYLQTYQPTVADRWLTFLSYHYNKEEVYPGTNETYSTFYARQIKQLVESNIPVVVIIDDYDNDVRIQHACIAYGYDENSQKLLFNTGWKIYHDANTLESEDDCIVGYFSITPKNINHLHSYNFKMNNVNVCSCTLPDHAHKYTYRSNNNSEAHTRTCFCGYSDIEAHRFIATTTKFICRECGYTKPNNGELFPILPFIMNDSYNII